MAEWLARRTREPAVAGSISTTAHVVISSGSCNVLIISNRLRYCNALKYELSLFWCAMMAYRGKDVKS